MWVDGGSSSVKKKSAPKGKIDGRGTVGRALPASGKAPWMRYAGLVESGNPRSSQTFDEIVYGTKN
jgi:hypothetical protein